MKKVILSAVMAAMLVSGCGGGGGGKKTEVEKPASFVAFFDTGSDWKVAPTSDGGGVAAGLGENKDEGLVVRKYDKKGSMQWEYKSTGYVIPERIFQTADDGYIAVGYSGIFNGNSLSGGDTLIVKLTPDGKLQWFKSIGGGV